MTDEPSRILGALTRWPDKAEAIATGEPFARRLRLHYAVFSYQTRRAFRGAFAGLSRMPLIRHHRV